MEVNHFFIKDLWR